MGKKIDFEHIIQSSARIVLPKGMVGKICKVLIFVAIAMAIIAYSVKIIIVSILALIFLFILCLVILWRLISFANKNPAAAILEGAEFITYEQIKLGTKNNPAIINNPKDYVEVKTSFLTEKDVKDILKPDNAEPQGIQSLPPKEEGS